MAFLYYNPNPSRKSVGDCVIRALCVIFRDTWENVYADLSMQGRFLYDMPNANSVWGEYLKINGFTYGSIQDTCPHCYTVKDFCFDHPRGCCVTVAVENVSPAAGATPNPTITMRNLNVSAVRTS